MTDEAMMLGGVNREEAIAAFERRLENLIGRASGQALDIARMAWAESLEIQQKGRHIGPTTLFSVSNKHGYVAAEVPHKLFMPAHDILKTTTLPKIAGDGTALTAIASEAIERYVEARMVEPEDSHALYSESTMMLVACASLLWEMNLQKQKADERLATEEREMSKMAEAGGAFLSVFAHVIDLLPQKGEGPGGCLLFSCRWHVKRGQAN